jgi:hypothetical protein
VSLPEDRRKQLEGRLRSRFGDNAFVLKARAWGALGQVPTAGS